MFTFVVWAIGLYIMFRIAGFNLVIIAAAFESNWFLGLLAVVGSLVVWLVLLVLIFG
jgi:hypothetical protein